MSLPMSRPEAENHLADTASLSLRGEDGAKKTKRRGEGGRVHGAKEGKQGWIE